MADTKTSFAQGQLRGLVERIERLEEEKKTIAGDIKEVYAEAKANGFDTKILRKVISAAQEGPQRARRGRGDARPLYEGARHAREATEEAA